MPLALEARLFGEGPVGRTFAVARVEGFFGDAARALTDLAGLAADLRGEFGFLGMVISPGSGEKVGPQKYRAR